MFKNYLKIAFAVLRRRKFFTFISLFGISFTLTILIVITACIDNVVGSNYPELRRDQYLYVTRVTLKDTVNHNENNSSASYDFLDKNVNTLKTPKNVAISSWFDAVNTYVNNKKIPIELKYTNGGFWRVLNFDFLEGKPYTDEQVKSGLRLAVISEALKKAYFGDAASVTGRIIEAGSAKYQVCGVVRSVPVTRILTSADMYIPYTTREAGTFESGMMGNYNAILDAGSPERVPLMQAEFDAKTARIKPPESFNQFFAPAESFAAVMRRYFWDGNSVKQDVDGMMWTLVGFTLFFMLLPAINLVNINITRIRERSSEISVRKAFGANQGNLMIQFLVENLLLTFIGTAIGILLSVLALYCINHSGLLADSDFRINFKVLGLAVLLCIVFGLISGVYPAWRMSKMQVVQGLKNS